MMPIIHPVRLTDTSLALIIDMLLTLLLAWGHDAQPLCFEPPPCNLGKREEERQDQFNISGIIETGLDFLCDLFSLSSPSFYPGLPLQSPTQVGHPVEQT